jgi:hypothetical protein
MGFGLVNFMAVAARHAQQQQAVPVRKVRTRGLAIIGRQIADVHALAGLFHACIGRDACIGSSYRQLLGHAAKEMLGMKCWGMLLQLSGRF